MTRFITQFDPPALPDILNSLGPLGAFLVFGRNFLDYLLIDLVQDLAGELAVLPGVLRVELDRVMGGLPMPVNDELSLLASPFTAPGIWSESLPRPNPWPTSESRAYVGADVAEADGITGAGVKVAVLDTGVDPLSPQLLGQFGTSTILAQPVVWDENGHGTHVASTIAGKSFPHPFGQVRGVAPGVELINIKVLGGGIGFGNWSEILAGMVQAQELGAKIISMSLGGEDNPDPEASEFRLVQQLTDMGIICCIAAGNSGPNPQTVGSPGSASAALTVGAIDRNGLIADFSSRGPTLQGLTKPDCTGPGVDILSATTGLIGVYRFMDGLGRFATISGTSMATPHISAVLALAEELARLRGGTLTTTMVKEALTMFGQPQDNVMGHGLLSYPLMRDYINVVLP